MARYRTNPQYAKKYRTVNWAEYNRSLVQRGNFALLISPEVLDAWNHTNVKRTRGGQRQYSDLAIEVALSFRLLFKMSLRQTQGFMLSLVKLTDMSIPTPDYSTLGRRARSLKVALELPRKYDAGESVIMMVDSTGLKMAGESEWSEHKHKTKVRRAWRKLHLGIDDSGMIIAQKLTTNKEGDALVAENLLDQVQMPITQFLADGAYDRNPLRDKLAKHNDCEPPKVVMPPRKDAVVSESQDSQRDRDIEFIQQNGRLEWEKATGYGMRNRVENGMYRFKTLIGRKLRSKELGNQKTEAAIGVNLMNWMTTLGMPKTIEVL